MHAYFVLKISCWIWLIEMIDYLLVLGMSCSVNVINTVVNCSRYSRFCFGIFIFVVSSNGWTRWSTEFFLLAE